MPELDLTLAWNFATALLIGALVGIERERHKQRLEHPEIAGLRTFILVALFGALSGWVGLVLATPWILAAGLVAITAFVLTGYVLSVRMNPDGLGLTTEMAAVATFLLGALATLGQRELAVGIGVIVAAVLAYKQPLHGFVGRLETDDVYAVLRLLIATFIILPILPDRTIDPWDALNPQSLWLLVLLIAGLSLVGYVLTRLLGAHRGIPLTGLTGGLVSSTAVTLSFARQSRESQYATAHSAIASGILLAWTVSFARVLVEVLVVNRALLPALLPALVAMTRRVRRIRGLAPAARRTRGPGAGRPAAQSIQPDLRDQVRRAVCRRAAGRQGRAGARAGDEPVLRRRAGGHDRRGCDHAVDGAIRALGQPGRGVACDHDRGAEQHDRQDRHGRGARHAGRPWFDSGGDYRHTRRRRRGNPLDLTHGGSRQEHRTDAAGIVRPHARPARLAVAAAARGARAHVDARHPAGVRGADHLRGGRGSWFRRHGRIRCARWPCRPRCR